MEFLNKNKKTQRNMEIFINTIYGVYTVRLCFSAAGMEGKAWLIGFFLTAYFVTLSVLISKYRNINVRAAITCIMIQAMLIMYAVAVDDVSTIFPMFMIMLLLVALYGKPEFLWITLGSLFFVLFYHSVITDNLSKLSPETIAHVWNQLGNIFCMEIVLYVWLKNRNEASRQMYQVVEALMDAEQSKNDFLANISHEIRTPVNTICGMSDMALREQDTEKVREELFDIRDAGHNLMSLVSDILDFSQLQQGKMNLEEEAYNITSTINDIINMAMARRGEKQIELIMDCAADIPSVLYGDEKKIRRVIMNLVDNAIKFTSEGGIIITVTVRKENYGVNLCVSVKDTGIGIEAASLEKLFESFTQVDTRRNRQSGGVGLGLAISKELIHHMGGTITVKSRPGRGSNFSFVVPQKVLDDKPIVQVEHREDMNIATYFDMEQFDMMSIRDEYTTLIINMVKRLQVRCHACRNLAELKRRESLEAFTHIFISLEEYQEDEPYFDEISKHSKVIIVIDRPREKYITNPNIIKLYKPFYILPVVSVLNGSAGAEGGKQWVRQGRFTAPEAHVLIVDDNMINIRVAEGLLKEYGIKVTYATSGMEALDMIEDMTYDLVFMDHMMPVMDGIEALHRIREKVGHYYQRVPIVVLTANAAPGNREMFLEAGFNDFVEKPIETSVLERVLKRNLPEKKLIIHAKEEPVEKKNEEFAVGDLNVEKGLLYCGGKELYLNVLNVCCEGAEEEIEQLNTLFADGNWKDYTIRVHAIKSGMKNIGADVLSAKAKDLEHAGKSDDIEFIKANHDDLLVEYRRVIKEVEQFLATESLGEPVKELEEEKTDKSENELGEKMSEESENKAIEETSGSNALAEELTEEKFDTLLTELEDAVYALDGEKMLTLLSEMQKYQYHGETLTQKLEPVKKKVEMSDYMSALETVSNIRDGLRNGK